MRLQITILFILAVFPVFLTAQLSLEPGFQLLERGAFAEAEVFFAAALDQEPDNRTARPWAATPVNVAVTR